MFGNEKRGCSEFRQEEGAGDKNAINASSEAVQPRSDAHLFSGKSSGPEI